MFNFLQQIRGHTIFADKFNSETIVVDGGAHLGEFSESLRRKYGCKTYLVEANGELANKLKNDGVSNIHYAALSAQDGTVSFITRANPEAGGIFASEDDNSLERVEVEAISLPTLLKRNGLEHIDLLKLDIEGAEFDLLKETSADLLKNIGQITVEFHDFLTIFKNQGLYEGVRDRLINLGFICCPFSFRTHGDVLFLNAKKLKIGKIAGLIISLLGRWVLKLRQLRQG